MLRNKTYRNFFSLLFMSIYLFVVLFSQNLHNHGSGAVFKDFHFKKTENIFSASSHTAEFTDCLSCHILHDGNSLIPESFSYGFKNFKYAEQPISEVQLQYHSQNTSVLFLRGPPENFI